MKAKRIVLVAATLMALVVTAWVGLTIAANVGVDFSLLHITILACAFAAHAAALNAGRFIERSQTTGSGKTAALIYLGASLVPLGLACYLAWLGTS